jgi:tetratricopeptide (TPR) repeat protein
LHSPVIRDKKGVLINPFYEVSMPGKIKLAIVFLILSVTASGSYIYSDTIYTKYLKFWHITVKKTSPSDVIEKAIADKKAYEKKLKTLNDKFDIDQAEKEYSLDTGLYLSRMSRVFCGDDPETVPPAARELALYTGLFNIEHGDRLRGASMVFAAIPRKPANDEIIPFEQAISVLYDKEMFNDIVHLLSRIEYRRSASMLNIHAISLFRITKYPEADRFFTEYEKTGDPSARALYFHAKTLIELRRPNEAVVLAEKARNLAPRDGEIRSLYVDLLNRAGKHKEAEKASR